MGGGVRYKAAEIRTRDLWLTDRTANAVCGGGEEAWEAALFFSQGIYFESISKAFCF